MNNRESYKKIIQESFLSKQDKEKLLQHLDNSDVSEAFLKLFNDLLIADIDSRIGNYEKSVQVYDSECSKLEDKYTEKKLDLGNKLDESLSLVEKTNLEKKKNIFDKYYTDVKKLQEEIKNELKSINAEHSLPFIQKAYEV